MMKGISPSGYRSQQFYDYVSSFRRGMQENPYMNLYPEVIYCGHRLGVNRLNLLYDIDSGEILSRHNAFAAYKYFYERYLIMKG